MSGLKVKDVITQIKTYAQYEGQTFFNQVGGATSVENMLEEANTPTTTLPAAFVIYTGRESDENSVLTGLRQSTTQNFDVVVVMDVTQDLTGLGQMPSFDIAETVLLGCLANWAPVNLCNYMKNMAHVESDVDQITGSRLIGHCSFSIPVLLTSNDGFNPSRPALTQIKLTTANNGNPLPGVNIPNPN